MENVITVTEFETKGTVFNCDHCPADCGHCKRMRNGWQVMFPVDESNKAALYFFCEAHKNRFIKVATKKFGGTIL